ncbi:hypothetical protein D3C79_845220 [compost metagenome]
MRSGEPQPEVAHQLGMVQPPAHQPFLCLWGFEQLLVIMVNNLIEQRLTIIIQIRQFGARQRSRRRLDS